MEEWRDKTFKGPVEALTFLQDEGYKVKKSKIYKDRGTLLRCQPDGSITGTDLWIYALTLGKSKISSQAEKEALHERKMKEEIRKIQTDIAAKEFAMERDMGKYILRDDLEMELAARAAVLETGLKRWIYAHVSELIASVAGDPKKADILIQRYHDLINELLNEYSNSQKFTVIFQ